MRIKRLEKLIENRAGLPLLGRLYKGTPQQVRTRQNGEQYKIMGKDTDEFRVEFELGKIEKPSVEDQLILADYKHQWQQVYCGERGEAPRRFDDVKLLGSTPDVAMSSSYELYDGKGLVCSCDGESRLKWWDEQTRRMSKVPAPCIMAQGGNCGCKPTGKIPVILMKFSLLTGIIGYFQLTTHSMNDIANLYAAMDKWYKITGDLTAIPFVLTRTPTTMSFVDEKTGERGKTTKSLLSLYANGKDQAVRKFIAPGEQAALSSGDAIGIDEPPPAMLPSTVTIEPAADDFAEPPRPRLVLKVMKVRAAFIQGAKRLGVEADEILERCEATDFNALEWFETCEKLGIDMEPPAELYKGK